MKMRIRNTTVTAVIGALIVLVILAVGTMWMAKSARQDTNEAVRSVSLLYLDELAGRREQVVSENLRSNIKTVRIAADLMTPEDLSDPAHLQTYQKRMKSLYNLDRFAFVGSSGTVYLSNGPKDVIAQYDIDYRSMKEPEIFVKNPRSTNKKVVIAVPIPHKSFGNDTLVVSFMEIDMTQMLRGVSMESGASETTFCNIYTEDGIALTNAVLGGLSEKDNLLDTLKDADFAKGYSYGKVARDFQDGKRGVSSFTYNGIRETLSYVPVEGTDWLLTYLIRESVISDKISSISNGIILRSVLQSLLTVLALLAMFLFIIRQGRKNARILANKEATEAEARVKQAEMEHRLSLQEQLLEQKAQGEQQSKLITALSSDYRSVYYLDLDRDTGICYQARTDLNGLQANAHFRYLAVFTAYCDRYIQEQYRKEFLEFIQPDNIQAKLKDNLVISYRYMIEVNGRESWEAIKFAGVRHPEDRTDHKVHTVGVCFADVDAETRRSLEQSQALSNALESAEQASRAKTTFLSNMSHEIRTPMNAIIGLDNIAINDPDTPEKIREYLVKIGDSAEHLLNLINDILDMSRIESGRLTLKNEEFSFSRLLEQINTMFSGQCADKGLDFHCHIDTPIDDYYIGDDMKLRQVLINILSNAVKFTPEGGRINLNIRRLARFDKKTTLQFTIADNGIGISQEFLPHIFDSFAQEDGSNTSRYGSSGLGLAITKNIVEMMNGNIHVESEKGKGSSFQITVTMMDAAEHRDSQVDHEIRPDEMTVLVVDDDPIACKHAKLVLEKVGISAEIASSGSEAIDMVTLRHARRTPYNLILVDWKMPELDGVETTRRMREIIGHESAIIILTAYRWDDVLEEALQAGVDSFLSKPLFASTVLSEFKEALKRKTRNDGTNQPKADLNGRRILLAEDVQVNAEIMMLVLSNRGMESELAVNGRIAVDMFQSHEPGYYDAILMDMRMPEMDGLEATRVIRAMAREDAREIPIIALTANAFDEDVQRSLQAGLNAHLSKPVQPDSLYETLESLIRDHPQ